MNSLVSVRNFSKSYGDINAVKDLSFEVEKGKLFGLIGPDGAGKTTTMRTLVTLLSADTGDITVDGMDVSRDISGIRSITGYMPQRFSLYPDLSIEENLRFFADLFEVPKAEIEQRKKRLYKFSRLEPFAGRLAGRLSGGMKQKLALSCTLIHDPVLLVLDEPTTGVDPVSRNEFWDILHNLKSEGVTIIVSTPYMDEALKCDRVIIMHEGETLATGKPDELITLMKDSLFALYEKDLVMDYAGIELLPGVHSVQSFGDNLHITTSAEMPEPDLNAAISTVVNREVKVERIEPSLEDIFIALIEEKQQLEEQQLEEQQLRGETAA